MRYLAPSRSVSKRLCFGLSLVMAATVAAWMSGPIQAAVASPVRPAARQAAPAIVVETESGSVAGTVEGGGAVRVFKGIPYAAPPVGNLRWKPPQPPASWPGVRPATEFGPSCPQAERSLFPSDRLGRTSEDCLTLNVWAPAATQGRRVPVIVWIHGGAFVQGSGSLAAYDGEVLARHGAVVVTFNYRLGPLGFFAHPLLTKESGYDASGNYGLLDQLAALRWVKANIRGFGGSPDRITVAGESAGAISIGCLLLSPQARGLFHAAILESGSPYSVTRYLRGAPAGEESMEEVGELVARRLGCDRGDDVLAALRSRSVEEVLNASHPASTFFGDGIRFAPVVDRWLIPDRPAVLLAARQQLKIPVLLGSNLDEGSIFVAGLQGMDVEAYRRFVRATFRDRADEVLARFPVGREAEVKPALARIVGYASFVSPSRRLARAMTELGGRVFLYSFTRVRQGTPASRLGAFHGSEVPFVFGTLGRVYPATMPEIEAIDRSLSQAMMGYWIRFASTGDPNGGSGPAWPRYSTRGDTWLELGADIEPRPGFARELCDFFDRVAADRPPRTSGHPR